MLQKNLKYIYYVAFILFALSAFYGLLIRWNFAYPKSGFAYDNMLQSHSHVAFLGWGFLACAGGIYQLFIKSAVLRKKSVYTWSILIMALAVLLMLISFPTGGYKVFSIVLLSVFGLVSYIFFYHVLKDLNGNDLSVKFIRWGIYYYILSSLATWFLAGVMVTQGRTDLYYNTVYFYLHFLYNGYFVFVLFGLLFRFLNLKDIAEHSKMVRLFFIYLTASCIPTYALSVLWSDVHSSFYIIGFAGALLQCIALFFLFVFFKKLSFLKHLGTMTSFLLKFVFIAFLLKILLQLLSSFPYFVDKSIALKPYFIIGYLHLFTLGFMSVFIILTLKLIQGLQIECITTRFGMWTILFGVILTELLLFGQGLQLLLVGSLIPYYNIVLLICSLVLILGMCCLFFPQFLKKSFNPKSFCQ